MRRRLDLIEARVLPRGWRDAVRQLLIALVAYMLYQVVRALADGSGSYKPFGDATKIINLERVLHVFIEPSVQAWTSNRHWLMDFADWTYLNAHYFVTIGALVFIYLRRNDSFYFIRNMFMIAMAIALVGYFLYPTAPPRLMPEWGFTDSISQFLGGWVDRGPGHAFLNFYAAVPSMHVCFALMIGVAMARLVRRRPLKLAWCLYPLLITFVVVATGNHYLTDVFLGALTAGVSALAAKQLLARARPDVWAFGQATA
ncbi:MAG: phosphatase PAP2 family protein [Solirubrobacterales bacterium]|nr:phosphatase PAP2 family protein [Solirubrobacterales bacterium]